ncbi:hypothetical protein BKA70DRAFT_1479732 [Coprinopsis sp. MPI-PUGE-AT-0042]|nr:hypothetical protein BKA70DRAFT_1479732 [Coprinopsis sp. MPI-PUGE-AT-0042]
MVPDPRLKPYINNNELLPDNLHQPLNQYLAQLEGQGEAYAHNWKGIMESIDSRRSMIQALEREIASLERRLFASQDALQIQKTRYRSTMGPMRRVPPEVLASIIHFAIAGRCGYVSDKGRAIFLDIRSVCRLWRTTAFSTPSLWRAIERDLTARHWRKPSIWNCLASWFSHAGEGAPLQVNVAVAVPYHAIDLFEFLSKSGLNITFLDISSAHTSGHWEYSSLEFLSESYEKPLLIKHLIIKSQNRPTDPPQSFRSIPLVDNFPHLQHLQLLQSQLNSPPSDISLPTLPLQFSTFTMCR